MARHERRVGYGLPTLLAIGVHVLVLLLTVLRWPDSEATPSSSSVVQATLVSTETATDKAQRVEEAKASAAQAQQAEEAAEAAREAERQRQEALKRAAEAAASSLDNLIAGEAQSIANAKQAAQASNSFINLVRNAVEQAWILPSGSNGQLEALVRIQLLPTGELISASISKSSGDATFDRSVLLAVERAAPFREMSELPASAQSQFREFNLDFNPEDVRR